MPAPLHCAILNGKFKQQFRFYDPKTSVRRTESQKDNGHGGGGGDDGSGDHVVSCIFQKLKNEYITDGVDSVVHCCCDSELCTLAYVLEWVRMRCGEKDLKINALVIVIISFLSDSYFSIFFFLLLFRLGSIRTATASG